MTFTWYIDKKNEFFCLNRGQNYNRVINAASIVGGAY